MPPLARCLRHGRSQLPLLCTLVVLLARHQRAKVTIEGRFLRMLRTQLRAFYLLLPALPQPTQPLSVPRIPPRHLHSGMALRYVAELAKLLRHLGRYKIRT